MNHDTEVVSPSMNDWSWYHVHTNGPSRIVRFGHDGQNPVQHFCIEIIELLSHGEAGGVWRSRQTILTTSERHGLGL